MKNKRVLLSALIFLCVLPLWSTEPSLGQDREQDISNLRRERNLAVLPPSRSQKENPLACGEYFYSIGSSAGMKIIFILEPLISETKGIIVSFELEKLDIVKSEQNIPTFQIDDSQGARRNMLRISEKDRFKSPCLDKSGRKTQPKATARLEK